MGHTHPGGGLLSLDLTPSAPDHLDSSVGLPSRRAGESGSKFHHAPRRPADFQKMTADRDKESGSDPGTESHGKREGKGREILNYTVGKCCTTGEERLVAGVPSLGGPQPSF